MKTPSLRVASYFFEYLNPPPAVRATAACLARRAPRAALATLALVLATGPISAAVVAGFAGGDGATIADQFPGIAGAGWSGPWATGSSNLASSSIGSFDTSPLSPAGGARLQVVGAGQSSYVYPQRVGVRRGFASTSGAAGVSLAQEHTVSWRFRLQESAATFNTAADIVLFADRTDTALGTGSNQTWAIRAVGGSSPAWFLAVGDGAGSSYDLNTGVPFVPGSVYDFQVTVHPGSSWGSTSWDVVITGPGVSHRRAGLRFRSTTRFTSGTNLQWTGEIGVANRVRTFSIDDVRVGRRAPELPRAAEEFVDSLGVNTHVAAVGVQPYDLALYGQLGVRHFRDNIKPGNSTALARAQALFDGYGIRMSVVCDNSTITPVQMRDFMRAPIFQAIEGLNEPDLFGPRSYVKNGVTLTDNWTTQLYPATTAYQTDLHAAMKADPLTVAKPVLTPAMGVTTRSPYLGTQHADALALHSYAGTDIAAAADLRTRMLDSVEQVGVVGVPDPELVCTETGYKTGSGAGLVSEAIAAKYIPRTLAEYFNRDIARTYVFEMTDTVGGYAYGLLRTDLVKKLAYDRIKNLITLLREATWNTSTKTWGGYAPFTPAPIDFHLVGAIPVVHQTILQKSDGTTFLLVWQEVSGATPPAAVPVTLLLDTPIASASTYLLGSTSPTATYGATRSLSLAVPDEILVVKLVPAAPPAPGPAAALAVSAFQDPTLAPNTAGSIAFTREGPTAGPLSFAYTVAGNAVPGTHYSALSGTASFGAGSRVGTVSVAPLALANQQGWREVVLRLADQTVDNLESGSLADWTVQPLSTVAIETSNVGQGTRSLRWTYNNDGSAQWSNQLRRNLPVGQDWSAADTLVLQFAPSAANPAADASQVIYFDWSNGGTSATGGAGAAQIPIGSGSSWRTVEIPLAAFPRDNVTSLAFYVNGNSLAGGAHVWFVDDIRIRFKNTNETDSLRWRVGNGILHDFESGSLAGWSTLQYSAAALETANVAQGTKALRWTFSAGSAQWSNDLRHTFSAPQDWSAATRIFLRLATHAANPDEDAQQVVFFDWNNGSMSVSGGAGVTKIVVGADTAYRTVEIDLGGYARNNVTRFSFYVNGTNFVNGPHIWFIDDIRIE